jgi:hypothetical protein
MTDNKEESLFEVITRCRESVSSSWMKVSLIQSEKRMEDWGARQRLSLKFFKTIAKAEIRNETKRLKSTCGMQSSLKKRNQRRGFL